MIYQTPSDEIFNELKEAAIKVWKTKDNNYGYVDEKLNTINNINNYSDNAMVFYRMFDYQNQFLMKKELSKEAIQYINQNR